MADASGKDEQEDNMSHSETMAGFIVDALLRAGILAELNVKRAIEIATEELEVWRILEEAEADRASH